MRHYLIAGNWKMHGSRAANDALVGAIVEGSREIRCKLLICPPFPYLLPVGAGLEGTAVALGAQTLSEHAQGAFTGEVAAGMLKDVGCEYVIVGHSERRSLFGESNEAVAAKFAAALAGGLTPILCVGETLEQREAGRTETVIDAQLDAVLERSGIEGFARAVVAYEPVWAIGTGEVATPQDAQEVCAAIRTRLAELYDGGLADEVRILYGGSVKGGNIAKLMAQDDVDGALVGGASLDPGEFVKICRYRDLPA